jgi:YD repeat-containing protein
VPRLGDVESGGHVRGRFARTFDAAGNTRLDWTLDSKLIEADATANQDGQITSKQLLTWWDQETTLIP